VIQIDYIKHLREKEDASKIATRVQCSWKTAKKYADGNIDLQGRGKRRRKKRVMEGYEEWIEAWIIEDQRMPKGSQHYFGQFAKPLLVGGRSPNASAIV
jgi:hypothetical protein